MAISASYVVKPEQWFPLTADNNQDYVDYLNGIPPMEPPSEGANVASFTAALDENGSVVVTSTAFSEEQGSITLPLGYWYEYRNPPTPVYGWLNYLELWQGYSPTAESAVQTGLTDEEFNSSYSTANPIGA